MSKSKYRPTVIIDIVEQNGEHRVTVDFPPGDFDNMNARGWPVEYGSRFPTRLLAETDASRIATTVQQYGGTVRKRWLDSR